MSLKSLCVWAALASLALPPAAYAIDPGEGSPTPEIRFQFEQAYFRGNFRFSIGNATSEVRTFGTGGYVQEFADLARPSARAAIVYGVPQMVNGFPVSAFQVRTNLYAYYIGGAGGFSTAGFPIMDSEVFSSPTMPSAGEYAKFQRTMALFAWYAAPDPAIPALNFTVRDPYYSRWVTLGELAGIGPPTSAETTVTSARGGTATVQRFVSAVLVNYTTGIYNGSLFAVRQPILGVYRAAGQEAGLLGLPTGEERTLADGRRQQSFEGGTIEYRTGETPAIRPRVTAVQIIGPNPLRLAVGERFTVRAQMETIAGEIVTDRPVTFSTSNRNVAAVVTEGNSGVVTGAGGGSAIVTATSEGVTSAPVTVLVTAPCCRVGEGAPESVAVAMQAAIVRNRIEIRTPVGTAARRAPGGWLQDVLSRDGRTRYVLAKSDSSASAFLPAADLLAVWEQTGGAGGTLGFPTSDVTAGGRQSFERATLSGRPPHAVSGLILARWGQLGFETGALGDPVSAAQGFFTFAATSGTAQTFRRGQILSSTVRTVSVSGRIYAKFAQLGGAPGRMGMPLGEEFLDGARRRQNFEGGNLSFSEGDPDVAVNEAERRPTLTATPASATPGNRVLIAIGGFEAGSRVRVSYPGTSTPPFIVDTAAGSFAWETIVPANAPAQTVTLQAVDTARPTAVAQGSYSIRAASGVRASIAGGDSQTGAPGATLPLPLRVTVSDSAGIRLAGQTVRWEASPGARIEASGVTDANGEAAALLRLPPSEGVALATAAIGGQVLTFSARSAARSIANFPRLTQIDPQGSQVAAAASAIRYLQQTGLSPTPQGLADPAALDAFLRAFCVADAGSGSICDGYLMAGDRRFVNLWRLAAFLDGALDIVQEPADLTRIRDLAAAGEPAMVALDLGGGAVHFVVAIGVGPDGSVAIHDPNPAFGRTTLDVYLAGFSAASGTVRAGIAGVARLIPRVPASSGFLVTGTGEFRVLSPGGACANDFRWGGLTQVFCAGDRERYRVDALSGSRFAVTSLGSPGSRVEAGEETGASFQIQRADALWVVRPQAVEFATESVVNGASFRPGLAPGGIATIFGGGLEGLEAEFSGSRAVVLFSSPFQANILIPLDVAPGSYVLTLRGTNGRAEQPVSVERAAPGIFTMPDGGGAVANQNATLNRPANPALRGQAIVLYCTGLGATERRGTLDWAVAPVEVLVGGRALMPFFAGATPGVPGLYQVNVSLPSDLAPGLGQFVRLRVAGLESNAVEAAIQ
ncbi:MAG: Ig-like domain-containing protein [Bryobacteraceae bacterium]|nr:Ig-like domain-containing protein [Bryobacteraceae bacterium]